MERKYQTSSSIAVKITIVAFVTTALAVGIYSAVAYYLTMYSPEDIALKLFGAAAIMLFLLAVIMYYGIKYAVQPINRVADVIERVSTLDLTTNVDDIEELADRNDEIGHIASCTLDMKDNLTNIAGDIQKLVG